MKLSKTALGILSAKYRAVLIRCLLASAVVFPSIASALDVNTYTELTDNKDNDSEINFLPNAVLNGNKHTFSYNDEIKIKGEGTLRNIKLTAYERITASDALTMSGNVYLDASTGGSGSTKSVLLKDITVSENSNLYLVSYEDWPRSMKFEILNIEGAADGSSKIYTSKAMNGSDCSGEEHVSLKGSTYKNISIDGKSNIVLEKPGTDALIVDLENVSITGEWFQTSLSNFNQFDGAANFSGVNTIVVDNFVIRDSLTVNEGASLTLNNLGNDGFTMNNTMTVKEGAKVTLNSNAASSIKNLDLAGEFRGNLSGGTLNLRDTGSFYGQLNGNVSMTDVAVVDLSRLHLSAGSEIGALRLDNSISHLTVSSDITANQVHFYNVAQVSGSGAQTIKTTEIYSEKAISFDNIKIASESGLSFVGDKNYTFNNVALSADGEIKWNEKAVFNGNSFLTAANINAGTVTIKNGTLTVDGLLRITGSNELIGDGGILNVVLPENPISTIIMTEKEANNVTLTLDLKNVKNKDAAREYKITDKSTGYTLSGKYGRYAFSNGSFTLDDFKAKKNAFSLTQNLWNDSNGTLWIMKVAGGAEAAIDDLRDAGVFVSPTEENASKILDMVDNPYADRLIDLLDSGDLGLQKQALRETVPTDAAQSSFKTARETALSVMNTVSGRLGNGSDVSGRSGGDLTVGRASVWAQGMVNRAKMTGGDGFKSDTAGFAAGVEANLTDEIKAGVGYAFASTDIKTDRSKTDADTHTGFVYGEYVPNRFYANAVLGFGRSDYDDATRVAGMKSSFRADTYSARVAAGYDAGILTPEAALRFVSVRQKAYTDALGARVAAKNLNTATAVAGAKAGKTFAVGKYGVSSELRLAAAYDIARPNEGRAVTLPDGSSYVAAGEHLKRLGAEIGAKAALRLSNDVEVSLTYDGAFKEHFQNHTGLINLSVGF